MPRVAVIQCAPALGQKAENLRRMARLIVQAAKGGAQLAVLPEMSTCGYSFMGFDDAAPHAEVVEDFRTLESSPLDPTNSLSVMATLARKFKIHLAWGFIRKDAGTGLLHNSQAYVDPGGFFTWYDKVNLWGSDLLWATEGRGNPPVVSRAGPFAVTGDDKKLVTKRLGLLICRDVRDKKDDAWSNFYSPGDADIVAFSTAWGDGGFPATAWMDFAKDNCCWLLVANRYGYECPNDFGEGGSCIISPDGKVQLQGLLWNQDCVIFGEVA